MSAQHTPGPWLQSHRQGADHMYRTEVYSEQHGGIATCDWTPNHCGNGVTVTYREANARLIAAAPTILQELIRAREYIAACIQSHAETVTNSTTGLVDDPEDVLALEADQDLLNGIDAAIAQAKGEA